MRAEPAWRALVLLAALATGCGDRLGDDLAHALTGRPFDGSAGADVDGGPDADATPSDATPSPSEAGLDWGRDAAATPRDGATDAVADAESGSPDSAIDGAPPDALTPDTLTNDTLTNDALTNDALTNDASTNDASGGDAAVPCVQGLPCTGDRAEGICESGACQCSACVAGAVDVDANLSNGCEARCTWPALAGRFRREGPDAARSPYPPAIDAGPDGRRAMAWSPPSGGINVWFSGLRQPVDALVNHLP